MTSRSYRVLVPLLSALAAPFVFSCGSDPPDSPGGPGNRVSPFGTAAAAAACQAAVAPVNVPSSNITIRFRNSSDAPRYLKSGTGCRVNPFTLKDSSGKELI